MEGTIQTQTQGSAQARQAIHSQNLQLQLLAQLAADLLAAKDPDQLVKDLFEHLSREFQIDAGFNYMVVEENKELQLKAYAGIPAAEAARIRQLRFGQAICGLVAANEEPIYVPYVQESTLPNAQLVRKHGIRAYACEPLIADGRLIGTISFATRHRDTFRNDELSFFHTISLYVSLGKERLRAEEELRTVNETLEEKVEERTAQVRYLAQQLEQAEQEERARLARDLHDSAGQLLTALVLNLQLLEDDVGDENVRGAVAEARQLATDAHREIRTVSHALRPPALELGDLRGALSSLCHDFGQQTGLQVHFTGDEAPDLD
ncbi:MAG TPA: GAF domain-containing protein, partial [Candidatus Sulfomarinibacteraceae bacterium]|nr:GAF domain-containing protein [Candidatus Sulfomarinibacteraceae bacterium]